MTVKLVASCHPGTLYSNILSDDNLPLFSLIVKHDIVTCVLSGNNDVKIVNM